MARETAQQRREREAVAEAMLRQQREDSYPMRFRAALKEMLVENFVLNDVNVETGMFTFYDRDTSDYFYVPDSYSEENEDINLEDFLNAVKWKRVKREEEEQRYAFRQATLAKLSAKEREVLGV